MDKKPKRCHFVGNKGRQKAPRISLRGGLGEAKGGDHEKKREETEPKILFYHFLSLLLKDLDLLSQAYILFWQISLYSRIIRSRSARLMDALSDLPPLNVPPPDGDFQARDLIPENCFIEYCSFVAKIAKFQGPD